MLPIVIAGMMGMCLSSSVGAALMMGDQKENEITPTPRPEEVPRSKKPPSIQVPEDNTNLDPRSRSDFPHLAVVPGDPAPERDTEPSTPRPEEVPRSKKSPSIQVPEDNMNVDPLRALVPEDNMDIDHALRLAFIRGFGSDEWKHQNRENEVNIVTPPKSDISLTPGSVGTLIPQ